MRSAIRLKLTLSSWSLVLEVGDEDRVEGFLVGYFLGNVFYVEFVFGVLGRSEG